MIDPFTLSTYIFCKYAGAVGVLDVDGNTVLYAVREGMSKIGKDIRIYTDKHKVDEILVIRAPRASKEMFSTFTDREYVIEDAKTHEPIGKITQKKFVRIMNDVWELSSPDGEMIGKVRETDLIRHFFHGLIIPRKYYIETVSGEIVGTIEQLRSLANLKFLMEIEKPVIDMRMLIAFGVLFATLATTL